MKRNHFTVAILASAISASSWAAYVQTPDNSYTQSQQVQGTSASGEKQTTIVDEGGNLKIIETPTTTAKPSTNAGSGAPSANMPMTTPGMMQSNPQGRTPSTPAPSPANPSATTPATPPATAVPMQPGPVMPQTDQNAPAADTQNQMLPPAQQAVPISQTPVPSTPSDNTVPLTNNQAVMPVQSTPANQNQ